MTTEDTVSQLDFSTRFRRSQGRMPRKYSATAKMTREEHNELELAARLDGKALGEWSRELLLAAARGNRPDPTFTEVIAMRRLLNSILRIVACGEKMTPQAFSLEMQEIRQTKHKAAAEVIQQYRTPETNG